VSPEHQNAVAVGTKWPTKAKKAAALAAAAVVVSKPVVPAVTAAEAVAIAADRALADALSSVIPAHTFATANADPTPTSLTHAMTRLNLDSRRVAPRNDDSTARSLVPIYELITDPVQRTRIPSLLALAAPYRLLLDRHHHTYLILGMLYQMWLVLSALIRCVYLATR
jgi:hypothetical protein